MRSSSPDHASLTRPLPGQRVGLLGGTFDPPHRGHLALALAALDSGSIDVVWLIPANTPPHKNETGITPSSHRLAMTILLTRDTPNVDVNPIELDLPGKSYTIRTLSVLQEQYPQATFRLIVGADMARDFGLWKNAGEILQIAPPLVADRPGSALPADLSQNPPQGLTAAEGAILQAGRFICPAHDISSTEIRAMLYTRTPEMPCPSELTPEVFDYLRSHRLYKSG